MLNFDIEVPLKSWCRRSPLKNDDKKSESNMTLVQKAIVIDSDTCENG